VLDRLEFPTIVQARRVVVGYSKIAEVLGFASRDCVSRCAVPGAECRMKSSLAIRGREGERLYRIEREVRVMTCIPR
jgi:hypothetical protein